MQSSIDAPLSRKTEGKGSCACDSKTVLPSDIEDFVKESTLNYGKVKLVLQKSKVRLSATHRPRRWKHTRLVSTTLLTASGRAVYTLPA